MKSVYATILNAPFLPRALALWQSIAHYNQTAEFAFFCIDEKSAGILESIDLPRCRIYRESQFASETLLALRGKRTVAEYCWTAKSFALCHLLATDPTPDWVVYLDSDMLAFGDPDAALADAGPNDFLLAPHRFSAEFESFASSVGLYNGGYVAFQVTKAGKAAASRWRDLCVESCPAIPTADSYADQKHLQLLLAEFPTGTDSRQIGLDAAPWNIGQYQVTVREGRVFLDDAPLLLYHFQSLRVFGKNWVDLYSGDMTLAKPVRDLIYAAYLDALTRAYIQLREAKIIEFLGTSPLPAGLRNRMAYTKRVMLRRANLRYYPMLG